MRPNPSAYPDVSACTALKSPSRAAAAHVALLSTWSSASRDMRQKLAVQGLHVREARQGVTVEGQQRALQYSRGPVAGPARHDGGHGPPGEHNLAGALAPLRVAGTFVLVHIGWLMFRETDTQMLIRDVTLLPWAGSPLDRQAALSLVLILVPFAAPLYVQGLVVEWWRGRREPFVVEPARPPARVAWLATQGVIVGALFMGILLFRSRASLDFISFQF